MRMPKVMLERFPVSHRPRHLLTLANKKIFLDKLAQGFTVSGAAIQCGFTRALMYQLREKYPQFARDWDDAIEEGKEWLEDQARRRAVDGIDKGIWYKGEQVATEKQYSDLLLLAMLKSRKPEYRDNPKFDAQVNVNVSALLDEARARLKGPTVINGEAEEVTPE